MIYSEVRKANGIYLPLSGNILNFCFNLPAHSHRHLITLLSEHLESQHSNLKAHKNRGRHYNSSECLYLM